MTVHINGHDLYYSIIRGSEKVINLKDHLNRINVFPVPDGDTGSNLTHTMNAIINRSEKHESVEKTLHTISRSAIEGARGNSGVIMAEYLGGLYRQARNFKTLTEREFAHLFSAAYQSALKAVSKPVDGSILSVMNDYSVSLHQQLDQQKDLLTALELAYQKAVLSLKGTQHKMKVLRDAGVVDSGANGFVAFIEGITEFFRNGREAFAVRKILVPTLDDQHVNPLVDVNLEYRYCYEILLEIRRPFERQWLETFGGSLIVAGNGELVKIHIHTDRPHDLVHQLGHHGIVLEQKLDDMVIQQGALLHRRSEIAIITDSIADLPRAYIDRHNVFVIPMNILIDNIEYLDRQTLTTEQFYEMADQTPHFPRSAMPKILDIRRVLDFVTRHYDQVVVLSVSSKLSGTHHLVNKVLKENPPAGADVRLIDTRLNSAAQGLLVQKAVNLAESGVTLDELQSVVESTASRTKIYVSVNDFSYMVRGGRVSPLKGRLAKVLNLKPIISLDETGAGIAFASAFSRRQNLSKITRIVKKALADGGIESYGIVHGLNPELADRYRRLFTDLIGQPPAFVEEISPVVGISAGPGAVAIAFVAKE